MRLEATVVKGNQTGEASREAPGSHCCNGETNRGRRPGKRLEATVARGKPAQGDARGGAPRSHMRAVLQHREMRNVSCFLIKLLRPVPELAFEFRPLSNAFERFRPLSMCSWPSNPNT